MRKSKYYVKKRGGNNINQNAAHPFANNMPNRMPPANDMPPTNNMPPADMPPADMQPTNNMQMNQMDMPANQMPNNNCPPCVCPPGNAEPSTGENKPASFANKVNEFNTALATKPGIFFDSAKLKYRDALNDKKTNLSNQIIGFLKPGEKAPPNINVGGRRRRTRRKRRGTRTKTKRRGTKTKRRGTKTKRRRRTRR